MDGSVKMRCRFLARLILSFCFIHFGKAGLPTFQASSPGPIREGLPPGTYYYKFVANDPTPGDVVIYSLDSRGSEWFNINATSGVATVKKSFDREVIGSVFRYKVFASDGTNKDSQIGSTVFTMSATDADATSPPNAIEFAFEAGNEEGIFEIPDTADGKIILKKPLDYDEGSKQFILRIIAKNSLSSPYLNDTAVLTINVVDVDDLPAIFLKRLYETTIVKDSKPGTMVTTVLAKDGDSFDATVEYQIYPESNPGNVYKIDNSTGEITVNGPLTLGMQFLLVTATTAKHFPTFTLVKVTVVAGEKVDGEI